MQQAIYNSIDSTISNSSQTAKTAGVVRWIVRKWDLVGVLVLMGSSAVYGVFALAYTGL